MNIKTRMFTTAACIGAVSGYLGALVAIERTIPIIKTNRLEIVNNSGSVTGSFYATNEASALALNNSTGKPGLIFGTLRDEPGMALLDIAGKPRGGIAVIKGTPGMWFGDSKGNQRLQFGVKDDTPAMELISGDGVQVWKAP